MQHDDTAIETVTTATENDAYEPPVVEDIAGGDQPVATAPMFAVFS